MIKKERHLKSWVMPTLVSIMLVTIISVSMLISDSVFSSLDGDNYSYVLRNLVSSSLPVNSEVSKVIEKPFNEETVSTHINYYDVTKSKEDQEKSLILYENTYMPNTGILYGCEKSFEVLAILEGEVTAVNEDEIFGTIVEVKHNNNLISKYASLSKVEVSVGDTINAGEIIGTSGSNKIVSVTQNMLLFELIHNGTNVNPEAYYNLKIEELS